MTAETLGITVSSSEMAIMLLGGILAGGHCIGMCGGLISAYSLSFRTRYARLPLLSLERLNPHLLYGAGRIITYTLIGAFIGGFGALAPVTGSLAPIGGLMHLLAGLFLILFGLNAMNLLPLPALSDESASLTRRWGGWFLRSDSPLRTLPLGMITGLLPCAVHWGFQAKALTAGSITGGALLMFCFGLGTAIPLTAFGLVATVIGTAARVRLLWAAGSVMLIMGTLTIMRGGEILGVIGISWLRYGS
ncbi:MAG: sulfite exporter TauE/SafE family protein [Magnetococcales bacterium]|nr:sulfite exporter TauE/SafE family protein [Magnetococcales bacterium]